MIKKYTCSNGVRIVLENIPTVRSVAIGVWIGTGSRNEHDKNNGISHFLEHMFFKGTKTRSAKDIAESFDRIGGQVNAFTSKEYTCYYSKVLDEHADYALEILADMFFNSTFESGELTKEKNVVYEEIKMYEDTPDDIVHDILSQATFGNHALAYPILGTEETLETFTADMLNGYMDEYYTPDNVVISVAGNVNEAFIEKIEKQFGNYSSKYRKKDVQSPSFFNEKIARTKDTEQAHLCIGFKGLQLGHENIYDLIILNNILGGSMSSRLFQDVREKQGLAYSIYSYHTSYKDSGLLTIYGGTANKQLDQLFNTIQETINELKTNGILEKELENSIEQMKGSLMLSLESTNSRMSRNGKNELLLNNHRSLDEVIDLVEQVTFERVNKLAKDIFTDDFSLSLIGPSGEIPSKIKNSN